MGSVDPGGGGCVVEKRSSSFMFSVKCKSTILLEISSVRFESKSLAASQP